MVLTTHQLFHLNIILKEAKEILNGDLNKRTLLASSKNISKVNEEAYYLKIIQDAEEIIKKGVFPNLDKDCRIHDYIEKYTKEEFYG